MTLYAGDESACQGAPILRCGEVRDSTLSTDDSETICLPSDVADSTFAVLTLSVEPGGAMDGFTGYPGSRPVTTVPA